MNVRRARVRVASWCRALLRPRQFDAAMSEEMRFHIDMTADRLMKERGLDAQEARRQAHVAFGGVEKYKEEGRDTRGFRWLDAVSLDTRLGIRMLIKHRGLTLVGGFAMAVTIAIGAAFFELVSEVLNPALPIEDGERVVALQWATSTPGSSERRVLHDFVEWRGELESVEQLGAFQTAVHTLVSGPPPHRPIRVAEISASGFVVARTPALLGRFLLPADESEGAAPVVVIGYAPWQSRFGGDPHVVGRVITLGDVPTTVIGVMPPGFRFPVDHHYWIPLRANPLSHERLRGPQLWVFGRLAPGISLQQAQAEFTAVGGRTATAHPALYKGLQPLVLPFTHDHSGLNTPMRLWMYRVATLLVSALTIVVAINLAILVYARTVTRLGEIAVRTALGAGRRRILAQLFIESLALSIVGAGAGLLLADLALDRLRALLQQGLLISGAMAYWIDLELSIPTFVYALALSIVAAFIMGVLPGLQATSGRVAAALRRLDVRSSTRLGPLWTTMVIVQVVVAVAVLPMSVYVTWQVARMFTASPAIEAEKFAVARVAVGGADVDANRVRARQLDFTSRLIAEPGVVAVTYSSGIPGFSPGRLLQFVAGQPGATSEGVIGVDSLDVAPDLFDVYGARTLAGRSFTATDLGAANAVVVNRTFVNELLNPSTALGARFRYTASTERPGTTAEATYEIVGIVSDFPGFPPEPGSAGAPTVYHPARPGDVHPFALSVRFTDRVPDDFPNRLRTIGAEVDPAMQLQRAALLTDLYDEMRSLWRYLAWGIGLVTLSVLLLSAAGIYAMMSFTIAQRTREIAIRMALGAAPHRLLLNTFSRVAFQLGLGVAIGTALSAAIFQNDDLAVNESLAFVSIVAAIMTGIGVFAAVGPARRGLRIEASEALKAE